MSQFLDVERTLAAFALPAGLLWLALLGVVGVAAWRRRLGLVAASLLILAAYSTAGNERVSIMLARSLEAPYRNAAPLERADAYDAIIVLGGGTTLTPAGHAQVGLAGDRVVLAARLFQAGRSPTLVATGGADPSDPEAPANQSFQIWRDLNVPAEQIHRVGGRNTSEEMVAIAALIEQEQWQRVGLVTSAWHMPRAQRLAKAHDLQLHPLPADFTRSPNPFTLATFVPDAGAFHRTQRVTREQLARLVGR